MVFEVLVCPDDIGATAYASRAYLATALMQFIERDRPAFHSFTDGISSSSPAYPPVASSLASPPSLRHISKRFPPHHLARCTIDSTPAHRLFCTSACAALGRCACIFPAQLNAARHSVLCTTAQCAVPRRDMPSRPCGCRSD